MDDKVWLLYLNLAHGLILLGIYTTKELADSSMELFLSENPQYVEEDFFFVEDRLNRRASEWNDDNVH